LLQNTAEIQKKIQLKSKTNFMLHI